MTSSQFRNNHKLARFFKFILKVQFMTRHLIKTKVLPYTQYVFILGNCGEISVNFMNTNL